MRPLIRKLGWCGFAVLAIGLSWWGWHLPPAPVCELESSNDCDVIGYSADGKWFAARLIVDDESAKSRCTYIWNARTGEKVQTLPQDYQIETQEQIEDLAHLKTWNLITLPSQPLQLHVTAFEYMEEGMRSLSGELLNAGRLNRQGNTLLWFDHDLGKWTCKNLTTGSQVLLNISEEWNLLRLVGDGCTMILHNGKFTSFALCDVTQSRPLIEISNVEALSISDDGSHAVFACNGALNVWDLRQLTMRRIPQPPGVGWVEDDVPFNGSLLISRNGRRLVAPVCSSLQDLYVVDVCDPPRVRRLHLPEPVIGGQFGRRWWFDATGDYLYVTNEYGELSCWYLGGEYPNMVARIRWGIIQASDKLEPLSNSGWSVGRRWKPNGGSQFGGGCIFGAPNNTFLGGTAGGGALGFTGGIQQTGLGFGGQATPSFCPDSKWAIQSNSTWSTPPPFIQWFGQYFPFLPQLDATFGNEAQLVSLTEWKIHGAWSDIESTSFSPDGKYIAVQFTDGPIKIWGLPPKPRWLVPILLQIPLLGVIWHWRPRYFRRNETGGVQRCQHDIVVGKS